MRKGEDNEKEKFLFKSFIAIKIELNDGDKIDMNELK